MINQTKDWYYADPVGAVHVGDNPPSGSTVLVCPGGTIPDELAERYKLTDRLKGTGDPAVPRDPAGNPIVVRGGKAYAASVLAEDDPARKAVEDAAKAEDEARAEAKAKAATAKKADVKSASKDGDDDDAGDDEPEPGLKVKADVHGKAVHEDSPGVEDKAVSGPGTTKASRKR